MENWWQVLLTIVGTVAASSGFWAFMQKKSDKNDARTRMLIGLAHDRIIYLGMCYIERGWITQDEYENIHDYLYVPYKELGGNGSAERIMKDVEKLEIRRITPKFDEICKQ